MQSRRRNPLVTAPPEDLDTQQTGSRNSVAYYDPPTGTCSTDFPGFCSKTTATTELQKRDPYQGEIGQPHEDIDGNLTEKRQNPRHSTSLGSSRRVGLRRVGLGCKRDLPSGQNAMFQARKEIGQKSDSYRPPTAPEFVANHLPGNVSISFLYKLQLIQKYSFTMANHSKEITIKRKDTLLKVPRNCLYIPSLNI